MASEVGQTREPESINVTIFKNGDINYRGQRVLLNKRKTKDLDTFYDNVTTIVKPREGCVRRLATPNHGTRIQDLDQLEPGGMYVAMCGNNFKKMPYTEGPKKAAPASPREIKPVSHSQQYRAKSSQYRKQQVTGVNFRVYPNGDELSSGCPINMKPFQMKYGWTVILDLISDSLQKACYRLCTVDGETVTDISSLKPNTNYVALGPHEKFQPKQYGMSPQASRNASSNSSNSGRSLGKREPLPPIKKGAGRSENSSAESKRENEPPAEKKQPPPARKPVERRPPPRAAARKQQEKQEEEDVFHAKPVKHKPNNNRNKKPRDYDKDEQKGVFRAKEENKETKGAKEVKETEETKTAYTIDQVEAEEVQDEEIEKEETPREETPREPEPKSKNNVRKGSRAAPKTSAGRTRSPQRGDRRTPTESRPATHDRRRSSPTQEPERTPTPPRENNEELERTKQAEAAVKIQSGYRGYQARRRVKTIREDRANSLEEKQKEEVEEKNEENEEKQEEPETEEEKKNEEEEEQTNKENEEEQKEQEEQNKEEQNDQEEEKVDEDEAASRIQASFRGHRARQDLKEEKERREEQDQAQEEEGSIENTEEKEEKDEETNQNEDDEKKPESDNEERSESATEKEERPGSKNENEERAGSANENEEKPDQNEDQIDSKDENEDSEERPSSSKERPDSKNENEERPGSSNDRPGSGKGKQD